MNLVNFEALILMLKICQQLGAVLSEKKPLWMCPDTHVVQYCVSLYAKKYHLKSKVLVTS